MTLHSRFHRARLIGLFWLGLFRLDLLISAAGAIAIAAFSLLALPPETVILDVLSERLEQAAVVAAVLLVSGGYLTSVILYLVTNRREIPFFQNHGLDRVRLVAYSFVPTAALAAGLGVLARGIA